MRPDLRRLRDLRSRVRRILRPWRGHVDGLHDGMITGWVALDDPAAAPPQVGLYGGGRLLAQTTANLWREDLVRAGIGSGRHGFAIPLDPVLRAAARREGRLSLRILAPQRGHLGHWTFTGEPPDPAPQASSLAQVLRGALERLATVPEQDDIPAPPPSLIPHRAFFARRNPMNGGPLPPLVTPWLDYLRRRHRQEEAFPLDDPGTPIRLLHWYLATCGPLRPGWRQPLSAAQIAWANATDPGAPLPRAAMLFLPPALRASCDSEAGRDAAAFWWAAHQAPALRAEDCLVPEAVVTRLARRPPDAPADWPLSIFLHHLQTATPALARLDPACEGDRRQITLAAMVMAADTPGILRFLPRDSITRALDAGDEDDRGSPLARFTAALAPDAPPLTYARYARALRLQGFDLEEHRFPGVTAEGDRLEPARLPLPEGLPVAVQVIGPFRKASGLGEAARATASALAAAGLAPRCVDFDMDNPAPEGFDPHVALAPLARAQVNILHLNAETLPLALASLPDVFTGARNIAYMFWELDSPAACHHLAFTLLDEIWVASDYGCSACAPSNGPPVFVMGLPAPDMPPGRCGDARTALDGRIGAAPGDFIVLSVFDSFSFVQRKNPLGAIAAFRTAFPDDPQVRLVLKTHNRRRVGDPAQVAIWEEVDRLIARDGRITLIDETLLRGEAMRLLQGADACLSLHRSEGWGFGMIEAMALGVPVVASGYSGNLAFCADDTAWLVPVREVEVASGDYIFVRPGQRWGEPDLAAAARILRRVRADPHEARRRAVRALGRLQAEFTPAAIGTRMAARLAPYLAPPSGEKEHVGGDLIGGDLMEDHTHALIGEDRILSRRDEMRSHVAGI